MLSINIMPKTNTAFLSLTIISDERKICEDAPDIIRQDGTREWYKNGEPHRENGPAVITPDGTQVWYIHGKCHRENGPALIRPDGTQKWYINGYVHCEDGPAIIKPDGTQKWYIKGLPHRYKDSCLTKYGLNLTSAPAIIRPHNINEYWIKGIRRNVNGMQYGHIDSDSEFDYDEPNWDEEYCELDWRLWGGTHN